MVRKLTVTVLIAMLSMQCFYKLACVTYYQLNKDYIAEFLCVNRDNPITTCFGQCFLKKALGFDSESAANSITSNLKFELPVFNLTDTLVIKPLEPSSLLSFSEFSFSKEESVPHSVFHPPLVIA